MTPPSRRLTRRSTLQLGAASAALLAGCLGGPDENDDGDGTGNTSADGQGTSTDDGSTGDDSDDADTDEPDFEVETVAEGFVNPWGMAFLPDGELLVTEREGTLSLVDPEGGDVETVDGTPEVYADGQGGLLDVALHPEFSEAPWVYLSYSVANDDGESTTALGRGRLEDGELEAFEALHVAEPYVASSGHFGSRVAFGADDHVYLTTGDRQDKTFDEPDEHLSQDTTTELGATLRLEPDGSIPDDNPFVDDDDVVDSIYSYGHRNAQGMTVHPETEELWQSEHGERDGDELNVLVEGGNYGWPITHTGCEYGTDDPVGEDPFERDDVVDPVYYWECTSGGFPPAGMTFYDGEAFPDWQGDLFVGTLAGEYLGRFTVENPDDPAVEEADPLLESRGWRIRDVTVEPDTGFLYVAVDDEDAPIVRLVPE